MLSGLLWRIHLQQFAQVHAGWIRWCLWVKARRLVRPGAPWEQVINSLASSTHPRLGVWPCRPTVRRCNAGPETRCHAGDLSPPCTLRVCAPGVRARGPRGALRPTQGVTSGAAQMCDPHVQARRGFPARRVSREGCRAPSAWRRRRDTPNEQSTSTLWCRLAASTSHLPQCCTCAAVPRNRRWGPAYGAVHPPVGKIATDPSSGGHGMCEEPGRR